MMDVIGILNETDLYAHPQFPAAIGSSTIAQVGRAEKCFRIVFEIKVLFLVVQYDMVSAIYGADAPRAPAPSSSAAPTRARPTGRRRPSCRRRRPAAAKSRRPCPRPPAGGGGRRALVSLSIAWPQPWWRRCRTGSSTL